MSNHRRRFESLKRKHDLHRTADGCWMFKSLDDYLWYSFQDDEHFANTVEAGYEVAFFTRVPDMALPAGIQ